MIKYFKLLFLVLIFILPLLISSLSEAQDISAVQEYSLEAIDDSTATSLTVSGTSGSGTPCDFSIETGVEKCFGGIGTQCNGDVLSFYQDDNTCLVQGWMSTGSILHDRCCFVNDNNGFMCDGVTSLKHSNCYKEFIWSSDDVLCGRFWEVIFGPYFTGTSGDNTAADLRAPIGAHVAPSDQDFCSSGKCEVNAKGKTIISGKGACKYCVCSP